MKIFTVISFLILVLLFGCTQSEKRAPVGDDTISTPMQVLENATLQFYDGSLKIWQLQARTMQKPLVGEGTTWVHPVKLDLYDSSGRTGTFVLADSGLTTDDMSYFHVWGDVYVRTEDSLVIKSEELRWDKIKHTVVSDTFVEITTQTGDVLRGKGLDANESFSRWSLRSSVSGTFPDFGNRVERGENIFGSSNAEVTDSASNDSMQISPSENTNTDQQKGTE